MEDFDNVKLMSRHPNIATVTGLRFDYANPTVGMISIQDIAQGLAKGCRFAGQCFGWYSVARHSVHVSERVERVAREAGMSERTVILLAIKALFHDSAEAYMNDCPSPFKKLLKAIWTPIEHKIERIIFDWLGLPQTPGEDPIEKIIHDADEFMYLCEWHDIMNIERIKDWYYPGNRPSFDDQPRVNNMADWREDYFMFMRRYDALTGDSQSASAIRIG